MAVRPADDSELTSAGSRGGEYPDPLLDAFDPVDGRGVVVFLGSGPSAAVGVPTWPELLLRLAEEAGHLDAAAGPVSRGELVGVATFLAQVMGEDWLRERAADLVRSTSRKTSRIHELLVSCPIRGVLTTNWDLLLTKADKRRSYELPMTWRTSGLKKKLGGRFVAHVHGHIDDHRSIVLTQRSMDDVLIDQAHVEMRQFVSAVFFRYLVIFIGFGFRDPVVDYTLRDLEMAGAIGAADVYAVIPTPNPGKPDPVRDATLRQRKIMPVYVRTSSDKGFRGTVRWLAGLCAISQAMAAGRAGAVRRAMSPRVLDALEVFLTSEAAADRLESALRVLRYRPDLIDLAQGDVMRLLDVVTPGEMRTILLEVGRQRPGTVVRNLLLSFPP